MEYLKALETINMIENKYDVMSVRYNGISVWPYLRCYLIDQLGYQKARKASASNVFFILKNLFRYNPLVLMKKMDIWSYSGVITRKKIGNKFIHHASGVLTDITDKVLNLENPESSRPHYPKQDIPEKNIISNAWSIFLSRALEYILRIKNIKIENEDILKRINKDFNVQFDFRFRIRLLIGQKVATDILLLGRKPKLVVMECPYDQMGYVWSFHNHQIPVIELQHGVLNENHYAYNSIYNGGVLAPDSICVYGENEYNFLKLKSNVFCKDIYKTGLYILEKANDYFKNDPFFEEREIYKGIIVVAGQTDCENELLSFIEDVSTITPEFLYIYIPRRKSNLISNKGNVRVLFDVNIYEYLKWGDIHCTVSSTTCLESQFFSTPNIFIELNNTAREYYGRILTEKNGSFYCSEKNDFRKKINYIFENKENFNYKELFTKGTSTLIKEVLKKYNICEGPNVD